ncbi:hypothetical protein DL98DRAFT_219550 [Cadophora sp. DSE1049]|nr:hypothetical protein DL98DRAFT_219550 [Cadophora sp. DSE1049]
MRSSDCLTLVMAIISRHPTAFRCISRSPEIPSFLIRICWLVKSGKEPDSALILAFWTCSQLEREFMLLKYPSSGLSQYEDRMPLPEPQEGVQCEILAHYICDMGYPRRIRSSYIGNQLLEFDVHLNFESPPTNDLQARSLATYHHTLGEVYRRVLRDILSGSGDFSGEDIEKLLSDSIHALLNSISAFHLIVGKLKLVVTNIYATGYMTSINVIVLLEIYQHSTFRPKLVNSITTSGLRALVKDTVDLVLQASPELSETVKELIDVAQRTGLLENLPPFWMERLKVYQIGIYCGLARC